MRYRFPLAPILLLGLIPWGSTSGEPWSTDVSLTSALPAAEVRQEPGRIDIGAPDGAQTLLEGWSWNQRAASGATYSWGLAPESRLSFFLLSARDLRVRLRGRPYNFPDAAPQVVTVAVNGVGAGALELARGWQEVVIDLPEEALRPGVNELALSYSRAASPRRLGRSDDRRLLAVAWDWIDFDLAPEGLPRVDLDSALLHLPPGTRLDFFFDLPAGGRFAAELARDSPLSLKVEILADEVRKTSRARLSERRRAVELDLPPGVSRLRLETPVRSHRREGSVLTLRGAAVSVHATPSPSAPTEPGPAASPCVAAERPHVFVYLVDTLRADRLSPYGSSSPVSPELDAFAGEAVVFDAATAQSSWTRTSVASILTGLMPWDHGVNTFDDRLPETVGVLPEMMKRAGYRTAAVVANPSLAEVFGFARGFDEYVRLEWARARAGAVQAEMLAILDRLEEGAPIFAYLHTSDPHSPYDPPADHRRRFAPGVDDPAVGTVERLAQWDVTPPSPRELAAAEALYQAEIAASDEELGRFLRELRRRDLFDGSLIVFLSDHGEEFFDHGRRGHGRSLYREVVRVPLLIKFPAGAGAGSRWERPVQLVDLLPTIAECAGVEAPPGVAGRSLASVATGEPRLDERPVFSYLRLAGHRGVSVRLGDWKLIAPMPEALDVGRELYDLGRDPTEQRDLAAERPVMAGYLASLLRMALREPLAPAGEKVELDDEMERQLRALGYLS